MKRYFLYLIIYIAAGAITACSDSWNEKYDDAVFEGVLTPSLSVSTSNLEFSSQASSQQLEVTSNTRWTATSPDTTWLTLSAYQGKGNASITVSAKANTSTTQGRSGTIRVTNGISSYAISVTQTALAKKLDVNPKTVEFSSQGGSSTISVEANVEWTLTSSATWLKLSATQGKGNASITVTAEANTSTTQGRTATITLSSGSDMRKVEVSQAVMKEILKVTPQTLAYSFQGGSKSVTVEANVEWKIENVPSWLTVKKNAQGTGFTVEAQQNISTSSRQATFTVEGVTLNATIKVEQTGVNAPTIGALSVTGITKHEAVCQVKASSADIDITQYGICYSSTQSAPTKESGSVLSADGGGKSVDHAFTLTGLLSKTTYYVRPYVVTALGTQYGETVKFTTKVSTPNEGDNPTPED